MLPLFQIREAPDLLGNTRVGLAQDKTTYGYVLIDEGRSHEVWWGKI